MNKNYTKMLRSGLAMVLALCMLVGHIPAGVFAIEIAEEPPKKYVSLGDSMTNGYGLEGYEEPQQDGSIMNWYGFLRNEVAGSTPFKVAEHFGWELRQIGTSGLRMEDVYYLLNLGTDYEVNWDEYGSLYMPYKFERAYMDAHNGRLGSDDEIIAWAAEQYQEEVKSADVISIALGSNNFATLMNMRMSWWAGRILGNRDFFGGYDGDFNFDELVGDLTDEERVQIQQLEIEIEEMMLDVVEGSGISIDTTFTTDGATVGDFVKDMTNTIVYTSANFALGYKGIIDTIIRENNDAEIIAVGLTNWYKGMVYALPIGDEVIEFPLGDLMEKVCEFAGIYMAALPAAYEREANQNGTLLQPIYIANPNAAGVEDVELIVDVIVKNTPDVDLSTLEGLELGSEERFEAAKLIAQGINPSALPGGTTRARLLQAMGSYVIRAFGMTVPTIQEVEFYEAKVAEYNALTDTEKATYEYYASLGYGPNGMLVYAGMKGVTNFEGIIAYLGLEKSMISSLHLDAVNVEDFKVMSSMETLMGAAVGALEGHMTTDPNDIAGALIAVPEMLTVSNLLFNFLVGSGVIVHPSDDGHTTIANVIIDAYENEHTATDEMADVQKGIVKDIWNQWEDAGYVSNINTTIEKILEVDEQTGREILRANFQVLKDKILADFPLVIENAPLEVKLALYMGLRFAENENWTPEDYMRFSEVATQYLDVVLINLEIYIASYIYIWEADIAVLESQLPEMFALAIRDAWYYIKGKPNNVPIIDYGTCGDNLTWTLDEEGTLTISGTGAMHDYYNDVPWYDSRTSIKAIIIEDGVTTIGDYAFYGSVRLAEVTIPDSVTTIGYWAFSNCSSLTSVTIPDSVTTIGDYAFYKCTSLTSVTIGDSVTTIGYWAFSNCTSLTSVTIGDSVTTIGNSAFANCTSLTSVTIPDSVTTIDDNAFANCTSLTSVLIGDSVTAIGDYAFGGCGSLTSITIPKGMDVIGSDAFTYCDSLSTVYHKGSQSDWNGIFIGKDNDNLTNATIIHNYTGCDHIWGEGIVTKVANCTATGTISYSCTTCGHVRTEVLEKLAHSWDDGVVTKEVSCNENGQLTFTCAACGSTKKQTIPALLNHSYDEGVVTKEATCKEAGEMLYTCTICGDTFTEVTAMLTTHSYDSGVETKAPTCKEAGIKTFTCSVCGESYTEEIAKLTTHSYDNGVETQAPTCGAVGIKTFTCTVCGDSYTEEIEKLPAHSYNAGIVTKPATCAEAGVKTFTCIVCYDSYTEEIEMLSEHSYNAGIVTKHATCAEAGVKTFTCIVCYDSYTEEIEKLTDHSYADGTCTVCGGSDPDYVPPVDNPNPSEPSDTTEPGEDKEEGGFFTSIVAFFEAIFRILFFFLYL